MWGIRTKKAKGDSKVFGLGNWQIVIWKNFFLNLTQIFYFQIVIKFTQVMMVSCSVKYTFIHNFGKKKLFDPLFNIPVYQDQKMETIVAILTEIVSII